MKKLSTLVLISMTFLMLVYTLPTVPKAHATTPPVGTTFDNIVIIAMENQYYSAVMGTGSYTPTICSSGPAPFIDCALAYGSTIPEYEGYGANGRCIANGCTVSGFTTTPSCSAACYTALIGGAVCYSGYSYNGGCVSDGYTCCISATTVIDSIATTGLTWQAYC